MQHMVASVIKTWRSMYPWAQAFDDRELAEIVLAIHYRDEFAHGTDGHHKLITIAKLFDVAVQRAL